MTHPNIFIIILNWNGKKDTLACLESLQKVIHPSFHTIVVDNGSTDGSVSAIREVFPDVSLIETGDNLGFAGGNNWGIEHALKKGADYLLLLNNDTVVDPAILEAFLSGFQKHPQAGILGAKLYLFDQQNQFDHFGGYWNGKKGSFDLLGFRAFDDGKTWEEMIPIDYACGCALFIKREVFEKIGLLEPQFFLIWEEADFCFRAKRAGYLSYTCPQAKVWHKVSASFVGGKIHTTYFWWRNRLLWIKRNCKGSERLSLSCKVLLPEILHLYKLKVLKTTQLYLLKIFFPKRDIKEKEKRLLQYKAALRGVRDYCRGRFGNGPSWIFKKR